MIALRGLIFARGAYPPFIVQLIWGTGKTETKPKFKNYQKIKYKTKKKQWLLLIAPFWAANELIWRQPLSLRLFFWMYNFFVENRNSFVHLISFPFGEDDGDPHHIWYFYDLIIWKMGWSSVFTSFESVSIRFDFIFTSITVYIHLLLTCLRLYRVVFLADSRSTLFGFFFFHFNCSSFFWFNFIYICKKYTSLSIAFSSPFRVSHVRQQCATFTIICPK